MVCDDNTKTENKKDNEVLEEAPMSGNDNKGDDLVEIPFEEATTGPRTTLVSPSSTVAPQVLFEPEHRHYHDKAWGLLYVAVWIAFLACGLVLVVNAHPRYERAPIPLELQQPEDAYTMVNGIKVYHDDDNNDNTIRIVSSHFREEVQQCCNSKLYPTSNDFLSVYLDLCSELDVASSVARHNQINFGGDDDDFFSSSSSNNNNNRNSKLDPGDGIFDAFLESPEIIVTLTILALFLAVFWAVLLRFFATPIVFCTELLKIAFFIYLFANGIKYDLMGGAIVSLICAFIIIGWDIYTYKKLVFAGEILSQAATSFKENPAMFCAFLPILLLYAGNACLFVWFFAKSFEVVEVTQINNCYDTSFPKFDDATDDLLSGGNNGGFDDNVETCYSRCMYTYPAYPSQIVIYLSVAYLWSVLLFHTMRLSIIATIIGSWHFHPDHVPGVGRALLNTCTTSMGTLSVSSLISAIAEKLNQLFVREAMWQQCCNPVFWVILPLYCIFGTCLRMLIAMLTKFCVILHVFTGKSWMGSAKKVFKILKRHFKGGFVTEYASRSVLSLGSYVFSIGIYLLAWLWMDGEVGSETFPDVNDSTLLIIAWLFFALFNIWYPVLGLYVIIIVNRWLSKWESLDPATWVAPVSAAFIGVLSMMFFTYIAGIFMDTVDTLFLCFAIDRDNNVNNDTEFAKLIKKGVPTVLEEPDLTDVDDDDENEDEEVRDVETAVIVDGNTKNNKDAPEHKAVVH